MQIAADDIPALEDLSAVKSAGLRRHPDASPLPSVSFPYVRLE
jgi:hypothetical protein